MKRMFLGILQVEIRWLPSSYCRSEGFLDSNHSFPFDEKKLQSSSPDGAFEKKEEAFEKLLSSQIQRTIKPDKGDAGSDADYYRRGG